MPSSTARHSNLRTLRREIPPAPKRMRFSPGIKLLAGALAAAAVLTGGIFVYRSRSVLAETVALTHGTVEMNVAVDGLVVRKEQVYTAPAAGTVHRLVAAGQRVRVGMPIAQIVAGGGGKAGAPSPTPTVPAEPAPRGDTALRKAIDDLTAAIYAKAAAVNQAKANGDTAGAERLQDELDQLAIQQNDLAKQLGRSQPSIITPPAPAVPEQPAGPALGEITAGASGVVIYELDGLEAALSATRQDEWKPSRIKSMAAEPHAAPTSVAKGDAVLKVVDNLSLNVLAVVPEASLSRLGDTDQVTIRFDGRDVPPVSARIIRQVKEDGDVLLVLTAPAFPEDLIQQRRFRATLVLGGYDGLLIPRSALDVRGGLQGVWVLEGTETRFHAARVLGGNDEVLALETDLQAGVRVLRQAPTWMR